MTLFKNISLNRITISTCSLYTRSPPKMSLGKDVLKICSKFTGEPHAKVAGQLYWNHTLSWVFSCKFAAYFQTILSEKRL